MKNKLKELCDCSKEYKAVTHFTSNWCGRCNAVIIDINKHLKKNKMELAIKHL